MMEQKSWLQRLVEVKLLVVLDEQDADAIITGVESERKGTAAVVTGRYFGLHDLATGSTSVTVAVRARSQIDSFTTSKRRWDSRTMKPAGG